MNNDKLIVKEKFINMKKKLLKLALPIGLLINSLYMVINRFIIEIPKIIALPILIISIVLIFIGIINFKK